MAVEPAAMGRTLQTIAGHTQFCPTVGATHQHGMKALPLLEKYDRLFQLIVRSNHVSPSATFLVQEAGRRDHKVLAIEGAHDRARPRTTRK